MGISYGEKATAQTAREATNTTNATTQSTYGTDAQELRDDVDAVVAGTVLTGSDIIVDSTKLPGVAVSAQAVFEEQASRIHVKEDFISVLTTNSHALINQSGTALTAAAVGLASGGTLNGHGGWLTGKTDDVDAEIDEVALGAKPFVLVSSIPNVARCEIGLVIPEALTARQYFFGWTDDETEGTGTNGSLNVQTGYTLVDVADNAAGFIFSSLATEPTKWKFASTNAGTGSTLDATTDTITGVVDAYVRLAVEVTPAGTARFYAATATTRSAELTLVGTQTLAVATTAILIPLFTAAPTTTTGVEWEIDYMEASVT